MRLCGWMSVMARDLVTDPFSNRYSESKLFAIVAKIAMTFAFVWVIVVHKSSSEWLWVAYGTAMLGHEWATRRQSFIATNTNKPTEVKQ